VIAAGQAVQRPADARLLVIDAQSRIVHTARTALTDFLRPGDLVVANDAATLPASLMGTHERSGHGVEVRLAGRRSLAAEDVRYFKAIVFGEGDYRVRTEDRPAPPDMAPGDRLFLGPLVGIVQFVLGHPRLIWLRFEGRPEEIWAGIARHGRPVQYAHMKEPLRLWDVWTCVAAMPVAFEAPSAGFMLTWRMLAQLRGRGIGFATLTHAAGLSSTGDAELDRRLPFDEAYFIPASTARAVSRTRAAGGRIVAIGTTVVRALEHAAAAHGGAQAGAGVATQRIGPASRLCIVDAILSGVHEPGTSHHELLRAFVDEAALSRADRELVAHGYRTHEFGDSVFIERSGIHMPVEAAMAAANQRELNGARRAAQLRTCAAWSSESRASVVARGLATHEVT
jgi:S-adenosylmethionine:tRNA ribosyltransferase-isomerase